MTDAEKKNELAQLVVDMNESALTLAVMERRFKESDQRVDAFNSLAIRKVIERAMREIIDARDRLRPRNPILPLS